jgi:phosphoribosylformimino-5-aminoimidazole carboxamide ribotide isomerase
MLIIPALYIRNHVCLHVAEGAPGTGALYPCDPVTTARMWRGENAKALHLVDIDAARNGGTANEALLRATVEATDIPVQVSGGIRDAAKAERMLGEVRAFRIVVGTMALEQPGLLGELLERHGPRKIVVNLDVDGGRILARGRSAAPRSDVGVFCRELRALGVERVIYTDLPAQKRGGRLPLDELCALAEASGLHITINSGVWSYADLARIERAMPRRIDSLILDQALYYNVFPCQQIWRQAERRLMKEDEAL